MNNRYLNHITLTTGDTRRSYRDEVSADAIDACQDLLDDALDQPEIHAVIPGIEPKCTLTAAVASGALIATVWSSPVELKGQSPQRAPLATIGVATRSTSGAKLWSVLHQMRPELKTFGQAPPGAPWVAARLEIGIALMPEAAHWLGDFERCLGHAWLESAEAKRAEKT